MLHYHQMWLVDYQLDLPTVVHNLGPATCHHVSLESQLWDKDSTIDLVMYCCGSKSSCFFLPFLGIFTSTHCCFGYVWVCLVVTHPQNLKTQQPPAEPAPPVADEEWRVAHLWAPPFPFASGLSRLTGEGSLGCRETWLVNWMNHGDDSQGLMIGHSKQKGSTVDCWHC